MASNKRLIAAGAATAAAFDPLQNFETVTYTGNGGTQKITGYIRKGAAFNGSNAEIAIPATATTPFEPSQESHTVSFWFNLSSTAANQIFMGKWSSTYGRSWQIVTTTGGIIRIWENDGTTSRSHDSTNTYSANTWHHLVYVRNGSSIVIYIDGQADTISTTNGIQNAGTANIQIGNQQGSSAYLTGKIDQVRFFNKALSSSEVTTLYGETYADPKKSTTDYFGDGSGVALYELDEDADATDPTDTIGLAADFDNLELKYYVNNILVDTATIQSGGHWFFVGDAGSQDTSIRVNTIDSEFTYAKPSGFSEWGGSLDPSNVDTDFQGSASGFNFSENNKKWDKTGSYYHSVWSTNGNYSSGKYYLEIEYFHRDLVFGLSKSPTANTFSDGTAFYNNILAYVGFGTYAYFYQQTTTANRGQILVEPYNGTATNVNFLGMAFQPDLVWVKNRSTTNRRHILTDSVRGAALSLSSDKTDAEFDGSQDINSLDSNGFTVGTNGRVNGTSGDNYVAWCWKGADTTVTDTSGDLDADIRANVEAGFSIIKHNPQTANNQTIPHGLSQAPELLFTKSINLSLAWGAFLPSILPTGYYMNLNGSNAAGNGGVSSGQGYTPTVDDTFITTPTTTYDYYFGYTGSTSQIIYAFHSVDGYQKIGSYSGASGRATISGLGFKPRFVMIKNITETGTNWHLFDNQRNTITDKLNNYLYANSNAIESGASTFAIFVGDTQTSPVTDYNDGFQVAAVNDKQINLTGDTFIYLAIA